MSADYISHTIGTYGSRTDTTLTAPAAIVDGSVLVLAFLIGSSSARPTPTPPAGFALLSGPSTVTDGSFSVDRYLWWKAAAHESGDYTVTHSSASSQGLIVAVSGAERWLTPTLTSNSGTGTTTVALGVTTNRNGAQVLFIAHNWSDYTGVSSPPAGSTPTFTERADGPNLMYLATGGLPVAGSTGDKSQTQGNAGGEPWAAWLIAIEPANNGGYVITE